MHPRLSEPRLSESSNIGTSQTANYVIVNTCLRTRNLPNFVGVANFTRGCGPIAAVSFSYRGCVKTQEKGFKQARSQGGGRGGRPTTTPPPPHFRVRSGEPRSRSIAPGFPHVVRASHALYYNSGSPPHARSAIKRGGVWERD